MGFRGENKAKQHTVRIHWVFERLKYDSQNIIFLCFNDKKILFKGKLEKLFFPINNKISIYLLFSLDWWPVSSEEVEDTTIQLTRDQNILSDTIYCEKFSWRLKRKALKDHMFLFFLSQLIRGRCVLIYIRTLQVNHEVCAASNGKG